jgi:CheY-like chemotaxis protein
MCSSLRKGGNVGEEKSDFKKIVIFDDSKEALGRFKKKFDGLPAEIKMFRTPILDENIQKQLIAFKPDIIVLDLIFGGFKEDCYQLIKRLQKIERLKEVPIVICSKLINDSKLGLKEKIDCLSIPGVVAAYAKFPDYPPAEEILKHILEGV